MQVFLTETTAKETTLNRKRNLFGLGFTSLIAACSSESASAPNPAPNPAPAPGSGPGSEPVLEPEPDPPLPLPFDLSSEQELTPLDPFTSDEYTAAAVEIPNGSDPSILAARITYSDRVVTDNIAGAEFRQDNNHVNLYKFENDASSSSFNLVVAAPYDNRVDDESDASYQAGIVKVYWGLTPDSTSLNSVNSLTINGIKKSQIGEHALTEKGALEFFLLGTSSTKKYDMLIASNYFIGAFGENVKDTGAIHILWDVADYSESNKTINLGNLADNTADSSTNVGATSGSLTIYDGNVNSDSGKKIGYFTPNFLQINDKDGYDMLIRVPDFDARGRGDFRDSGAIHILWDVANYSGSNKSIDLGNLDGADVGATYGSLAIYGSDGNEWIGDGPVNFFQIGGKTDEQKYDMVFEGWYVDKRLITGQHKESAGAIHILWDVADYYSEGQNKVINFHDPDVNITPDLDITYGSLIVYGAKAHDEIGTNAPEFLQIAGKAGEQKHDMVFNSGYVNKDGNGIYGTGEGAIYILWDVADYYSEGKNKAIDLATPQAIDGYGGTLGFGATSGLLTIYGKSANSKLGEDNKNIIYSADTDADGNKTFINIDEGHAYDNDTKDIVFKDEHYTYILFGDKVANDANGNNKVDSKSIDLTFIEAAFTADTNTNAGFFSYNFGYDRISIFDDGATITSTRGETTTGYRFASGTGNNGDAGYKTLAEVQAAYTTDTSGNLSDTDADLGVWDIA